MGQEEALHGRPNTSTCAGAIVSGLCGAAVAVVIHLASIHSEPGFNNDNYGIGASCRITDSISIDAGIYKNSYSRPSVYAAGEYRYNFDNQWALGATLGVASNYPYGSVIGGVTVHTPSWHGWSAGAVIGPKIHEDGAAFIHLTIAKEFR